MAHSGCPYERLYIDHHGWLLGWLRRRLGCRETAADLAHDTFLRLLAKRRPVAGLREPRAYLATVARATVANHRRRQELEQAYLETLASRPEPVAISPEERRMVMETLETIDRLLDGLPARVREIFLLSQLDGLTYPRIAERLGLTVNVVQKAMLKAVRHCYGALYE